MGLGPEEGGEFFLELGFEFGVGEVAEGGPVEGGLEAFAVGGAEPEFDGEFAFADVRVFFDGEAFLDFDLGFRGVGFGVFVERRFGILELEQFAFVPRDGGRGEFIEPGALFGSEVMDEAVLERRALGLFGEREA